jgi:hypothetical protein
VLHGVSKVLLDPGLSQLIPVHVLNTLCLNIIVGNVKHRVTTARWTTKESQFLCWYGQGVFLVFTALTQARPNEPPIQYAACAFFFPGVKLPNLESVHLLQTLRLNMYGSVILLHTLSWFASGQVEISTSQPRQM